MKLEDLGIDRKTGRHDKVPLTFAESKFLGLIWIDHVGEENKISADKLALRFAVAMGEHPPSPRLWRASGAREIELWKRSVRKMHNHLLVEHNVPILSKSGSQGGYWIAEGRAEAAEFYETFRRRGLTGLVKASRGKQSAMVDMVTQLSFEFQDMAHRDETREETETHPAVQVVDAFLEKMLKDPEQFSEGLKQIGEKYGSVLIPRDRYDEIKIALEAQAQKLGEMARGL